MFPEEMPLGGMGSPVPTPTEPVSALRILKNVSSSLVSLMGALIIGFAVSWLLARSLGDTVYGQYVFLLGIAGILTAFADLGLSQVNTREVARDKPNAGRHALTAVGLRLTANGVILIVALVLLWMDADIRSHELMAMMVIVTMMITLLSDLLRSTFNGFERLELDLITRISERAVTLVIIILLVVGGISLDAAITGILVGAVAGLIITVGTLVRIPQIHPMHLIVRDIPALFTAGLPIGLSILVVSFYARYDVLVLGILRTPSEVAWFSVAYSLVQILVSLSFAASSTLFPVFSRLAHNGQFAHHQLLFREALRYTLVIAFATAGLTFVSAWPIISLMYGPTYAPATEALHILSLALAFMFPVHLMINVLFSLNRQRWVLMTHVVSGVMLLFLDPILISWQGVEGAAISNVIIEGTIFIICLALITRLLGPIEWGTFLRPLGAAAAAALLYALWPLPELPRAMIALALYVLGLIALRAITAADVQRFRLAFAARLNSQSDVA
ncbi:MAG TPA: flippase [Candidatus Limnocylindrales bacterium]|nr:flippase [Candidatus Limnocylindrales bacterium]